MLAALVLSSSAPGWLSKGALTLGRDALEVRHASLSPSDVPDAFDARDLDRAPDRLEQAGRDVVELELPGADREEREAAPPRQVARPGLVPQRRPYRRELVGRRTRRGAAAAPAARDCWRGAEVARFGLDLAAAVQRHGEVRAARGVVRVHGRDAARSASAEVHDAVACDELAGCCGGSRCVAQPAFGQGELGVGEDSAAVHIAQVQELLLPIGHRVEGR